MNAEQQKLNRDVQIEEQKPTASNLSDSDMSLLIQFFQTLDEWDRQSTLTPAAGSKGSSHDSLPVSG